MSDSNGSKDLRPSIHLVGGSVCLIILFSLVWLWSARHTEHRVDAERYAKHYQDEAIEKIKQHCAVSDMASRLECETKIIQSAREAEHDAQDLNAQRDSAYWGSWAVIAATASAFITLIGIFFVWKSLELTRKAVDAAVQSNAVAREIGEAQVRAYLVCESAKFAIHHDYVTCEPVFENSGQSPAQDIQIEGSICIELSGFVFPMVTPHKPNYHHATGVIGHCQAIGAGKQKSGFATILHSNIDKEAFFSLYKQEKYFDLRLAVSWRDAFKVRHSISVLLIEDRRYRGSAMEGILNRTAVIRGEMKAHNHGSNYDVKPDS